MNEIFIQVYLDEDVNVAYFNEGKEHWGIIISSRKPVKEIFTRLLVILNEVTSDEIKNQIVYI